MATPDLQETPCNTGEIDYDNHEPIPLKVIITFAIFMALGILSLNLTVRYRSVLPVFVVLVLKFIDTLFIYPHL